MLTNKKILFIIAVLALCLALIVTLKVISTGEKNSLPRGVLVERMNYYGC